MLKLILNKYFWIVLIVACALSSVSLRPLVLSLVPHKDAATGLLGANKTILAADTQAEVIVTHSQVVVRQKGKADRVIKVPKSGRVVYTDKIKDKSQLATPQWVPQLVCLPHIGLSMRGLKVEPIAGVQVVRLEPMQLGLSCNLTTSNINLSLDKDLFDNSAVGVYYGITNEGSNVIGVHFSLFF